MTKTLKKTTKTRMHFETLLAAASNDESQRLEVFAFIILGLVESIARGELTATDAITVAFNAENGIYVRKHFKQKAADRIMSHGVQLPDLFDALSPEEANRQLHYQLEVIRSLCLQIIKKKKLAA